MPILGCSQVALVGWLDVRSFSIGIALALIGLAAGAGVSHGASAVGPTVVGAPSEVGAAVVGQRLTAERGAWSGSATITYHYQWYRCDLNAAHCGSIHGATARSYKLVAADAAHAIGLTVQATDSSGTASAYASVVGPVAPASAAFVSTVQPSVTGVIKLGQTVQVDSGAWSPNATSFAYSWLRCNQSGRICAPIANAIAAAYTVTAGDVGHALVALVTGSSGGANLGALSTAATAAASSGTTTTTTTPTTGPLNVLAPTVTGSAVQSGRLTGAPGTWSGSGAISYAYQWYRCDASGAHCSSIHGATAATYKLVALDAAHTMGLTVNASNASGHTSAYASLVGPITTAGAPLIATEQPAITASAANMKRLTVSTGTWSPGATSYRFAWQRCNANGRVCAPIAGATSALYTVTAADRGHKLLAIVQASAGNSSAETLSRSVLAE
jgi:hypothetical protein